ncbi:GIY-YIG nuclease family protein [Aquimarina sp. 2-A2]|uniref:GIY-YIG nuclease family protein n=1 Tax=Aquimarina sp. 2-A2 TaxID=3382644 RepID=UPI00387EEAD0
MSDQLFNSYELSRRWFDFCFENPEEITLQDILSHKIRQQRNYLKGGFYLIKNTKNGKCYVGKSKDYMSRLKQHIYKSSSKTKIDKSLNEDPKAFKFYLLANYKDIGINFFNRKLETIIEHIFITVAKSFYPEGYNNIHYGHL